MVVGRAFVIPSSLLALGLGLGCASEPGHEHELTVLGEIGNLYHEYVDLLNDVDRYFCGCRVKDGKYENVQECMAATGGPALPPLLADCYAGVLDNIASSRDYVECQISEYMQYLDCLESVGCGGNVASCQQMLGSEGCPQLSYAANAALAEGCLGYEMPPPFECADGKEIVPWYECNFWPDCADGSDEHAGCPEGFHCQSGEMIPNAWACDGSSDCPDGDDEANCG